MGQPDGVPLSAMTLPEPPKNRAHPTEVASGFSGKRRNGPWFSFQLFWTSS